MVKFSIYLKRHAFEIHVKRNDFSCCEAFKVLTLKIQSAADTMLILFFRVNKSINTCMSCESPVRQMNHLKCQALFFAVNRQMTDNE